MAGRGEQRDVVSRSQWAARIARLDESQNVAVRPRRPPVTVSRIVDAALQIVAGAGFDAVTMRQVAGILEVSPGALYVHVADKAELDDLMIGRLCSHVVLPAPNPARWQAQVVDVCGQLRDQYLRYPGIARAVFDSTPHGLDALRIFEGLMAIVRAGGVPPQSAAWAIDASLLYTAAYCAVSVRRNALRDVDGQPVDRAELVERFRMLPADRFPNVVTFADAVTVGEAHDRFDFALGRLLSGLDPADGDHYDHSPGQPNHRERRPRSEDTQ